MSVQILVGDCRDVLRTLPAASVHCCITSPPYFGLRDYGMGTQIGMEPSPDEFVAALVDVFREVRRVLRDDGTVWLNLGDSYAAQRGGTAMPAETLAGGVGGKGDENAHRGRRSVDTLGGRQDESSPEVRTGAVAHRNAKAFGLKHKDLIGIPWRVAFALQADGWYLRSDIIWHKPNPMPESVTDRPTKAHEYLFLLAKSERYYYDADAIAEPITAASIDRLSQPIEEQAGSTRANGNTRPDRPMKAVSRKSGNLDRKTGIEPGRPDSHLGGSIPWEGTKRNKRSVWSIAVRPFSGAHFATFPPALVEPCILAGSSTSTCATCGASWRMLPAEQPTYDGEEIVKQGKPERSWCGHESGGGGVPVVLDPFGGAGTTGLVSDRLGRNAILVELNPEYASLARQRITSEAPLFSQDT